MGARASQRARAPESQPPAGAAESSGTRETAMFEDSTFESSGRIHTRSRAWSAAAFALNAIILAALIVIPLIYPEALPRRLTEMLLSAPPVPVEPRPPEVRPAQAFHGRREFTDLGLTVPTQIPIGIRKYNGPEDLPPGDRIVGLDGGPGGPVGNLFGNAALPPRVVSAPPKGPQRISSGVANGMLIDRVLPAYPPIAREAGIQGTVVLEATITTAGTIRELRVVSGPQMLRQAAVDAVSRWRYRPYLLNGQPIEVETTISVVFSMGR
jgi:protein TonB